MTEKISVEDATNEYYRLKNLYETSYYEKYIKPIVKAEKKSKREKRVEFSKLPKAECVNCKRNVGTTFLIVGKTSERVFTVKCGDINAPCPLNINIVTTKYNTFADEINKYSDDIDKLKTDIIKEKYNIMFGYTPEENGIENFTNMSTELKDTTMLAGYVIEKNILVNSNPEKEELLRKSVTIFGNDYLLQFKQMVDQFNQHDNEAIMTEAAKFYADEMVPRLKEIQGLKYDECFLEYDQDSLEYKLYQIKNSLANLETSDSSDAKVVSFVTGLKDTGTKTLAEDKSQKKKKKKKLEFIIEGEEEVVVPDYEYAPNSPVYAPNSPEYNPSSPPQTNNNFTIHGEEVEWTDPDPDYASIWAALSPKYKAILVQDPAWMRKTMDEFVAVRQTSGNVSRDFVMPDDILLPPKVSEEGKELDFGNPVLNDLVMRLTPGQREIVINSLPKKETSNEEDYKPMFGILKHMLKTVVDFRPQLR
jgi:hypothetical protein